MSILDTSLKSPTPSTALAEKTALAESLEHTHGWHRSAEERHALIAETAYFLAERRHFAPGHELDDWLAAEEQVNLRLYGEARAY
jgi:hypothetical protein